MLRRLSRRLAGTSQMPAHTQERDRRAAARGFLAGEHVVVTGAGRNVGKAIVLEMLEQGARVTFTDRLPERCAALEAETRGRGTGGRAIVADVANLDDNSRLVHAIDEDGEPVTTLVNNVGIMSGITSLGKFDPAEFRSILDTNVVGPLHLTRLIVDRMIARRLPGAVIFLLSLHAQSVRQDLAYSASKAALTMIVRELAVDLAPHGIRVNGIAPGWVWEGEDGTPAANQQTPLYRSSIPPRYIGRAACFLASEYFSRHTTGTVLTVDGGLSLFNNILASSRAFTGQ